MTSSERDRIVTARAAKAALALAVCLLAAAAAAWTAARSTLEGQPAYVHVRWIDGIEDSRREQLEQRFRLSDGAPKEGSTSSYGYSLNDTSRNNIRALVTDPAVADTHEIDRSEFRVSTTAERIVGEHSRFVARLRPVAATLSLLGSGALALAMLLWFAPAPALSGARRLRAVPGAAHAWLARCVPDASPDAVAAYRVTVAAALVAWLAVLSPAPSSRVTAWVAVCGVLFFLGVATRASFAALVAGTFAWAASSGAATHAVSALLVTLLCLLPSRWGDAWSIDAWWRRRRGGAMPERSPKEYGYTIWLPGLVLGTLFAAAAVAKLRASGLEWITNGTVKYHFLTDSVQAPVDWGLRLGSHDGLAVALSFGALAIEAAVLPAVLVPRYWVRAAAGAAVALLLAGFYLLQGVFWPGWWLLLTGFLPWHLVGARSTAAVSASAFGLRPAQLALASAVVAQQVVASALGLEVSPLLSEYDMYSTSYASHEEYEAKSAHGFQLVAEVEGRGRAACDLGSGEAEHAREALALHAGIESLLARCFGAAAPVRSVSVEVTRMVVDWRRWRLLGEAQVTLAGPVRLASER